jgi:catechol 2,3-dioxygenase-like lactoylglutathione lyase family enzyme
MNDRRFTYVSDHVAIRVASIDRATEFYRDAFGARELTDPFPVDGALARGMVGGPDGVSFRMRQVGFDRGVMELVEFTDPIAPTGRVPGQLLNILHIGLEVDDVPAALHRVERAGGTTVVPITEWGPSTLCFCTDPDGTVLELADASIQTLLEHTRARQRED